MTAAPAWPEWLPAVVSEYAEHLLAGRTAQIGFELPLSAAAGLLVSVHAAEAQDRLHRLTHDPRMKRVWQALTREMGQVAQARCAPGHAEAAVLSWLRGFLLKALTADLMANSLANRPNPAQQRATLVAIATHARALIALLGEDFLLLSWITDRLGEALAQTTCPEGSTLFRDGKRLTKAHVPEPIRALFARLATETYSHYWSTGAGGSPPPITKGSPGSLMAVLGGLVERLEALAALADVCADAPAERIPNQTAHFNASVYVQQIAEYLAGLGIMPRLDKHREKGFPLHQLIAITANVALSSSRKLNADFVRRQIAGNRR